MNEYVKMDDMNQSPVFCDSGDIPDISIVIVSWNAKASLLQCLQSVYETTKDLKSEIFVVDNRSTDGSPEAVVSKFPQVNLIRNEINLGFARANNIGITRSSAPYIYLINSDIFVLPGCISNLLNFMKNRSRVGIASPRLLNEDGTIQRSCSKFPGVSNVLFRAVALDRFIQDLTSYSVVYNGRGANMGAMKVDALAGAFWIVRREALTQVGLLDEDFFMYGEDIDWCRRFHKSGWDVVYHRGIEAIHFGAMSSSNAPIRFFIEIYKSRLLYWKKHHGRLGKAYYVSVMIVHQILRIIPYAILYLIQGSNRKNIAHKLERSVACLRWLVTSGTLREA